MLNVLRKEAIKNLLKNSKIEFNKDIETTLKNTKYENLLIDLDPETQLNLSLSEYQDVKFYLEGLNLSPLVSFLGIVVLFRLKYFDYPEELEFLMKKLEEVSNKSFIVGGAIRDIILDIKPKDFDIVTDIPYDKLKEIFKEYPQKEVGKHFKVLTVKINDKQFEIANFRKDIYKETKGSGADEVEIGTLKDDIQRRDFDVNCLYYNPFREYPILIDGNQTGLLSLHKNEFKFVGKSEDRIKEDVLRLLRIGKLKKKGLMPTKETMKAFRNNFHLLCELGNPERIREHIEDLCFR